MKKAAIIGVLLLAISGSVLAGTLASYNTVIDNLAGGNVSAREFILLEEGTDSFGTDFRIAPSESVSWRFAVKNFNGDTVSEQAMSLAFHIELTAAGSKQAVNPLVVTVRDQNGAVVGAGTGTGKIPFMSFLPPGPAGQAKIYTVTVEWPSDNAADPGCAGEGFGTAINVSVTGVEIAEDREKG